MQYLNSFDYVIIGVYFSFLIGLGLYLKRKASASLEDYFLGGRNLPWWALGMSGMASYLDITGTMVITSFLFMLGPRGLFIAFRGGAALVMVFVLIWVGKWYRRSRCITGAEWMVYRFGNGPGGQFARTMTTVATIITTVGMIAYMVKGVGLFLSMFLPSTLTTGALIMITVASAYTLISGFYGVVYTDIFQSGIIFIAVVVISVMATQRIASPETLAVISHQVTGNAEWTSTVPGWKTTMPAGYEAYRYLTIFALFYLLKNTIDGVGFGDDPKYFGARSDRECGKLTFLWTWLLMFRWPLMIGFAVLGIYMVYQMFPDQTVLAQAAELVRQHLGDIPKSQWPDTLAGIINNPSNYPQQLSSGLAGLLGDDWTTKLNLLSYEGTVNPERILPAVIFYSIPRGIRGLILVALIAASMSTFDSNLNRATGFLVRDVYQAYIRPRAANKELMIASYLGGLFIVIVGFLLATTTESINDIWVWIIMGLGAGLIIPRALRFYWWRFNGGGFACGTLVGLVGAIALRILFPGLDERAQFILLIVVSITAAVIGTYATKPTDKKILEHFYKTTRPFGFWGPLKRCVSDETLSAMKREHRYDIISIPFVFGWHVTLLLLPMQLIIRAFTGFWITFGIFVISLAGMYKFWYKNLPQDTRASQQGNT